MAQTRLKKRIRKHLSLAFSDVREEAALLVQDDDSSACTSKGTKVQRNTPDIGIFTEQATSSTLELENAVAD